MLLKVSYINSLVNEVQNTKSKFDIATDIIATENMKDVVKKEYPNISKEDLNNNDLLRTLFLTTVKDEHFDKTNKLYPYFLGIIGGGIGGITGKNLFKRNKLVGALLGSITGGGAGYSMGHLTKDKIHQDIKDIRDKSFNSVPSTYRGKYADSN